MGKIYSVRRFSHVPGRVILPGNTRECDPMPVPYFEDPKYKGIPRLFIIEESSTFKRDFNKLLQPMKDKIKILRKSLKGGHLYDNGNSGEETHYKASESKPKEYHRLTKDINKQQDRLEYLVYPPELSKDKLGNVYIVTKVVLVSCHLHRKELRNKNKVIRFSNVLC